MWYGVDCDEEAGQPYVYEIWLDNNMVGTLPAEMANLTKIEWIGMGRNDWQGTLPPEWGALDRLVWLDLGCGTLWGAKCSHLSGTLPPEWSGMTSMTYLYLDYNDLEGPLPESWGAMVNMGEIYLHDNQLTGTIPASWGAWQHAGPEGPVWDIFLHNNQLSGELPIELTQLVDIYTLDLSGNGCFTTPATPEWNAWVASPQFEFTYTAC